MKKTKVFMVVVECESDDASIQDYIAETLEDTGEVVTAEQVFEESINETDLIGSEGWLEDWTRDGAPSTVKIKSLTIKEIV